MKFLMNILFEQIEFGSFLMKKIKTRKNAIKKCQCGRL